MSENSQKVDEALKLCEQALEILDQVKEEKMLDLEGGRKILDGLVDVLDNIATEMSEDVDDDPEGHDKPKED